MIIKLHKYSRNNITGVRMMALALLAAVTLGGCKGSTSEEEPLPSSPYAIDFRITDSGMSRASTPLENTYTNFHVVADKTVSASNDPIQVIPGYRVVFDSEGWIYSGHPETPNQYLKFWDLMASHYTFSAVAPTPDNSEEAGIGFKTTTVEITPGAEIKINNVHGNLSTGDYTGSTNAPEWLVAQTGRDAGPLADIDMIANTAFTPGPATFTDKVPLNFHHIMAKVDFYVWSVSPVILKTFIVDIDDSQPLVTRADYSSTDGWTDKASPAADSPLKYCEYVYLDGKTTSVESTSPTLLASHVQIPQEWAYTGRNLRVTFVTTDNKVYGGTITLNIETNKTNSWLQNAHYRYVLCIDTGADDTPVVLFGVDMDTWKWKEGSVVEDKQTGW